MTKLTDDHTVLTTVCAQCLAVMQEKAAAYDEAEREWVCPSWPSEKHVWVRLVREIGDTDV